MKVDRYSIHIFSEKPNAVTQSFLRAAKERQRQYELFQSTYSHATTIEYPHAVSFIDEEPWYEFSYMAEEYSKRRKAPVLVCNIKRRPKTPWEEYQVFQSFWAKNKRCIARVDVLSVGTSISIEQYGLAEIEKEFGCLLPENSILFRDASTILPMVFAARLGAELGIELGVNCSEFLDRCVKTHEYQFDTFYKVEDSGTVLPPSPL